MRTLARIGLVSLFAVSVFLVGGAAATDATLRLPGTVTAGQRVDVDIRCQITDTRALIRITGGLASMDTRARLRDGARTVSMRVPPTLPGRYHVALTCDPSGAKASKNVTVTV